MRSDEQVSPELALVDPELAERLRRTLSIPYAAPARRAPSTPTVALPSTETSPPYAPSAGPPEAGGDGAVLDTPSKLRAAVIRLGSNAGRTLLLLIALLPFLAFLPPRGAPIVVNAPAQTARPPDGWLAWAPDREADYYAVQFSDGAQFSFTVIPTAPMASIPRGLAPGRYTWRVFAGHGPVEEHDWRGPVAEGSFSVAPA